jgi:beta-phosphoglucomutase-like phosphatase (HAD superfamily)
MFGILFDLDGTLLDSDPIHFESWQKILAEANPNAPLIDREFFDKHISGRINNNDFLMIYIFI